MKKNKLRLARSWRCPSVEREIFGEPYQKRVENFLSHIITTEKNSEGTLLLFLKVSGAAHLSGAKISVNNSGGITKKFVS